MFTFRFTWCSRFSTCVTCLLYRQIKGIPIQAFSTRLCLSHAMHALISQLTNTLCRRYLTLSSNRLARLAGQRVILWVIRRAECPPGRRSDGYPLPTSGSGKGRQCMLVVSASQVRYTTVIPLSISDSGFELINTLLYRVRWFCTWKALFKHLIWRDSRYLLTFCRLADAVEHANRSVSNAFVLLTLIGWSKNDLYMEQVVTSMFRVVGSLAVW